MSADFPNWNCFYSFITQITHLRRCVIKVSAIKIVNSFYPLAENVNYKQKYLATNNLAPCEYVCQRTVSTSPGLQGSINSHLGAWYICRVDTLSVECASPVWCAEIIRPPVELSFVCILLEQVSMGVMWEWRVCLRTEKTKTRKRWFSSPIMPTCQWRFIMTS